MKNDSCPAASHARPRPTTVSSHATTARTGRRSTPDGQVPAIAEAVKKKARLSRTNPTSP
jgi:hypothetical protein